MKTIVAIRMRGRVGIKEDIEATFTRLRLQKKFSCVLLTETPEHLGMLKKLTQHLAYGTVSQDTIKLLMIKRGRMLGNKPIDEKKITDSFISQAMEGKVKGFKPFFRLQPPKGGFKRDSRRVYPQGILGNWKDKIAELLEVMI